VTLEPRDQHSREYVSIGAPYIARAEAICSAAHDRLKAMFLPSPVSESDFKAYNAMAARVLDETITELRADPPPEPFRAEFEQAYEFGDRLVRELRREAVGDHGIIHAFGGQPGLHECTFDLPS
jgi:hypothetical protein